MQGIHDFDGLDKFDKELAVHELKRQAAAKEKLSSANRYHNEELLEVQ